MGIDPNAGSKWDQEGFVAAVLTAIEEQDLKDRRDAKD
jgi:hypothetical protein